jgi:hypothetical protein
VALKRLWSFILIHIFELKPERKESLTLQTKQNRKQGLLANCFNIFFQVTLLYITLPYKLSKIESKAFWQIVLRYFFKLHYFTLQYITIHYIKLQTHLSK